MIRLWNHNIRCEYLSRDGIQCAHIADKFFRDDQVLMAFCHYHTTQLVFAPYWERINYQTYIVCSVMME